MEKLNEAYIANFEKKTAKIAKQLDEMGYTTDGKKK